MEILKPSTTPSVWKQSTLSRLYLNLKRRFFTINKIALLTAGNFRVSLGSRKTRKSKKIKQIQRKPLETKNMFLSRTILDNLQAKIIKPKHRLVVSARTKAFSYTP